MPEQEVPVGFDHVQVLKDIAEGRRESAQSRANISSLAHSVDQLTELFTSDQELRAVESAAFRADITELLTRSASQQAVAGKVSVPTIFSVVGVVFVALSFIVSIGTMYARGQSARDQTMKEEAQKHEDIDGHPAVIAMISGISEKFTEIETQFREERTIRDLQVAHAKEVVTLMNNHNRELIDINMAAHVVVNERSYDTAQRVKELEATMEKVEDEVEWRRSLTIEAWKGATNADSKMP